MKRLLLAVAALLCASAAAQTINPNQIRPSATNGQVLTTEGGVTVWNTPSGGGANFPGTNGIVFNTSTSASRNAIFSDIVPLWGGGSCSGFLKNDGTCGPGGSPSAGAAGTIQASDGSSGFSAATSTNIQTAIGANIYDAWGAAGKAGFTVVVAASNSVNKTSANIICSGTADQTCINSAIALCPNSQSGVAGCHVMLQDGIYHLTDVVIIDNDDVDFSGVNHCMWGGYNGVVSGTPNNPPTTPVGSIGTGCAQLLQGTSGDDILQIQHNNPGGTGTDTGRHRGIRISNIYFVGNNYTGNGIRDTANDDHLLIDNNIFQRLVSGINVNLDSPDILLNTCQDMINCINLSGEYGHVNDNLLFDITGTAIQITTNGGVVHNNTVGNCLGIGISAGGSNEIIEGNHIRNCIEPIKVSLGSTSVHIQNNSINVAAIPFTNSTHSAIDVVDGSGMMISGNTGNTFYGNAGAFITMGSSTNSSVVNNNVLGPWNYGGTAISMGSGTNLGGLNLASFVPAAGPAVITSASLQASYEASSITGVTTGSPISTFPDDSGFNRTLGLTTGTGPIYVSSSPIISLPAVQFNGTTAWMIEGEDALPPTSPKTIFAVVRLTAIGKISTMATSASGANTNSLSFDTTNHLASYAGTYTVSTLPTVTTGTTYVVELANNGASTRLAQNGASQTINNGSNIWSSGIVMGSNGTGSGEYFPGYIAAEYIYTGQMTTADAALVGAALCSTYAVTCGSSW